jgi:hypothetical protein
MYFLRMDRDFHHLLLLLLWFFPIVIVAMCWEGAI